MIRIPDPSSSFAVADWVELFIVVTGQLISKARLSHMVESASGEEPTESFILDVWRELSLRQKLYINCPFTIDNLTIESNKNVSVRCVYVSCLIMSIFGAQENQHKISKLFERVTCLAVKKYLSGDSIVFGWPVEEGETTSIRDRIIELAGCINERYVESPAERYKDRGVDVVGWKAFGEGRPSQIVVLLQCAAGLNWRNKTTELPMEAWIQYIHWSCNPIKAFAVPCIVSKRDWHDVSKEGGILFDRIRIINLLSKENIDSKLSGELDSWIVSKLNGLN